MQGLHRTLGEAGRECARWRIQTAFDARPAQNSLSLYACFADCIRSSMGLIGPIDAANGHGRFDSIADDSSQQGVRSFGSKGRIGMTRHP
jgi:hypothetical protein